jgi:membrane protein DedA with SNARE-associated domain
LSCALFTIVIDAGSVDGTPAIAEQHGARVLPVAAWLLTFNRWTAQLGLWGAVLAFPIARYFARDRIAREVGSNPSFEQIDRAIGEQGPKLVFLLRLSPLVPFNLSNYFYGLTAVNFWPYVLASWIGTLPGTADRNPQLAPHLAEPR